MKDKISTLLSKVYNLKNKIAFFPSIIALAGVIFAYIMMYLENEGISAYLQDFLPELVINDKETARTILSTFIAGLTSIMVFSFSMVMILLNQASSNFSPRLLPGLISNRRHQIVLGIYLFTIIYCIFILVFIEPNGEKYQLPGFSVLLSIVFMIHSLAAFIYFIHSISQEIQINNILLKIYVSAEKKLLHLIEDEKSVKNKVVNTENWIAHKTKYTGYFKILSIDILVDLAHENNFKLEILSNKGSYCSEDEVLFKTNIAVNNDILESIHGNFTFSKGELIDDNYLLAFKQITEVAVKSMSPGINDPGTAINAIDYLSELLILRVQKRNIDIKQKENEAFVFVNSLNFEDLLYNIMAAIRTYCSHDVVIVTKLLTALNNVKKKSEFEKYNAIIDNEIRFLLADANTNISNKDDLNKLENYASSF
ncbi:DUF2254 domain-containing protein [Polaribacter sp. IC073]|uniref:DUF2254 domain-containing protein n=1 Tax=Polaribacter sp. IC073 TaxID=2508540 RepID=UPI0011BF297F|nr:DUF2254 domain-containing protein [Polaribacter sp. IC073]TXD49395.1 DUF2254 domain-containing protein [Polaribacter sp. IC073]